jgi:toxin CcdB
MAQFDIYRLRTGGLVMDCQTEELATLPTRFVVPLLDPKQVPQLVRSLHPIFEVDGKELVMATHAAAAVSKSTLGKPVQSLAHNRYTIIKALDFLTTGV